MSAVCGYCETEIDPVNNINGYCSEMCKFCDEGGYISLWKGDVEVQLTPRQRKLLNGLYDAIDENEGEYSCGGCQLDNVVSAICNNPRGTIEFLVSFFGMSNSHVAKIHNIAAGMHSQAWDAMHFGPSHIVWEDDNFEDNHILWCIQQSFLPEYDSFPSLALDAVRWSLTELLKIPEDERFRQNKEWADNWTDD